ncbi:MAG: Contactin-4, partial [Paramarteilia canceri]
MGGPRVIEMSPEIIPIGSIPNFELRLFCKSDFPFENCYFEKNGTIVSDVSSRNDEKENICSLHIENPTINDTGKYRCLLENAFGSSYSRDIHVTFPKIFGPFEDEVTNVTIPESTTTILQCLAGNHSTDAEQFIQYNWSLIEPGYNDERYISEDSINFVLLTNGSLAVIDPTLEINNTKFICTKTLDYITHKIVVKGYPTKLLIDPNLPKKSSNSYLIQPNTIENDIIFLEDEPLKLTVVFWNKSNIEWRFNNVNIEDIAYQKNLTILDSGRTVYSKKASRQHQGIFKAVNLNDNSYVKFRVRIESKPKPVPADLDRIILKYSSEELSCSAISDPKPNCEWFINTEAVTKQNNKSITLKDSNLLINNIDKSLIAQCNCSNSNGYSLETYSIIVAEPTISALSTSFSRSFEAGLHQYVSLPCLVSHDQNIRPVFEWKMNNEPIIVGNKYTINKSTGAISFKTVSSDEGTYSCNAHTPFDNVEVSIRLMMNPDLGGLFYGP